jgi:hypothetical protein
MMDPDLASLLRFVLPGAAIVVILLIMSLGGDCPSCAPQRKPEEEAPDLAGENRRLERELRRRRRLP